MTDPLTWLPALAYLTTFGVELTIDSQMANILFTLFQKKRPGFTQTTAGYYTSILYVGVYLVYPPSILTSRQWLPQHRHSPIWWISRRRCLSSLRHQGQEGLDACTWLYYGCLFARRRLIPPEPPAFWRYSMYASHRLRTRIHKVNMLVSYSAGIDGCVFHLCNLF